MMHGASAIVEVDNAVAKVPERIFGSFVEHLGRCVYGGIFDPQHSSADHEGFRHDVLDLVKELGVTCVRYPGGNFVSGYRWEDGIGPREKRPVRRDLAWHTTEPNLMGIDDFYRWSRQAGTEIMLAINLGTRGLQEALDELEYVNGAAGTYLADLRVKNGIKEPMNIKMWCLGNEMDGPWQVGHQSPDEYARLVDKVAHAMKLADSSLDLVACGSSSANMTTFGTWEEEVLTAGYENLDFVSCHDYYSLRESGTLEEYAASTERMKIFISTVEASAEKARQAHQGDKKVALSFDEWGVWDSGAWNEQEALWKADNLKIHDEPWPFKPHLLEQIYTAADAVVEGSLMITLLSSCDVVRSASRAQLVNVIAPIMAEEKGPAWRQSVFYPFAYAARYAKGTVYVPSVESSQIQSQKYGSIDAVQLVVTREEATGKGCLLVVNRDVHQSHDLRLDISALEFGRIVDSVSVHNDDPFAVNSAQNDTVVSPRALDSYLKAGVVNTQLPPLSWSCIAMEQ